MTTEDLEKPKINISAGFWRRILALFYDSLLLIGIIIGFLLIITFLFDKSFETPFERLFLQISYLVIGFLFFTYFWKVNNGQTLGMQVWKIKIVGDSNEDLTIKNLFNFFFGANFSQPISKFLGLFALLIYILGLIQWSIIKLPKNGRNSCFSENGKN